MSSSLNNFCESLVNGSNPRYTWAQSTPAQQVAWQVQKEQESKQAQMASIIKSEQARFDEWKNRPVIYDPRF